MRESGLDGSKSTLPRDGSLMSGPGGVRVPVHECRICDSRFVNGVRIDLLSKGDFMGAIEQFVNCGQSHVIHFIPADPTVIARKQRIYRNVLNRGDLNVADGMSIVWALRFQRATTERIPGTEAFLSVCDLGQQIGLCHYMFGGSPETLESLVRAVKARFPAINIGGSEAPPFVREFDEEEICRTAQRAKEVGASCLWVGLGTPKQDYVADILRTANAAPVILCVGAAFDFVGGSKRRAPRWICRAGFEWLHRLATEPRRLWRRYLIGNVQFIYGVLRDRGWSQSSTSFDEGVK